jgi:hypothetical protein
MQLCQFSACYSVSGSDNSLAHRTAATWRHTRLPSQFRRCHVSRVTGNLSALRKATGHSISIDIVLLQVLHCLADAAQPAGHTIHHRLLNSTTHYGPLVANRPPSVHSWPAACQYEPNDENQMLLVASARAASPLQPTGHSERCWPADQHCLAPSCKQPLDSCWSSADCLPVSVIGVGHWSLLANLCHRIPSLNAACQCLPLLSAVDHGLRFGQSYFHIALHHH